MSSPSTKNAEACAEAHTQLFEIEVLKQSFDSALSDVLISGEFLELAALEQQLETALESLERTLKRLEWNPLQVIRDIEKQLHLTEGTLRYIPLEVGGMTAEQLITAIEHTPETPSSAKKMRLDDYAKSMLCNTREFLPTTKKQQMHFVCLAVPEFGFSDDATTEEIFTKAKALGLKLCPPDTGPHLRLHLTNQTMNECLYIGMDSISGSGGDPALFCIGSGENDVWLDYALAAPDNSWDANFIFVFRIPQPQE